MSTELIILMVFTVSIMVGVIKSIPTSFEDSAPKLSARIERQLETGVGFAQTPAMQWKKPK